MGLILEAFSNVSPWPPGAVNLQAGPGIMLSELPGNLVSIKAGGGGVKLDLASLDDDAVEDLVVRLRDHPAFRGAVQAITNEDVT